MPTHRIQLEPEPTSVAVARRLVASVMDHVDDDTCEIAQLLVSELATNAVVHTGCRYEVECSVTPDCLRVTVRDPTRQLPRPSPQALSADGQRPGGRGISIVDALASRWGIDLRDPGKAIWFELDAPSTRQ